MNDTDDLGARLAGLARGWMSLVNLIRRNPTPGSRWSGSSPQRIRRFAATIRASGVPVTVRDTRGSEIDAACGQLHAQLAGRDLTMLRATPGAPTSGPTTPVPTIA
jgi:23S rRNA (adenine2503-C2)-methyltransferase